MKEIDFSNCQSNARTYNGANGSKIGIYYNNKNYMLKFPPKPKNNIELSYTNSCISEYVSCKILKTLGLNSQDTILGKYRNKIVVACKDFRKTNEILADFASLKNTIIESSSGGYDTELSDILETIDNQEQFNIKNSEIKNFFWNMFIADSLLGNFDRHNGNWGFLINEIDNIHIIAPIYDCGFCLYPQADENLMKKILTNKAELEQRIYTYPNSAIKDQNVKINPYHFLLNTDNLDCINALQAITARVDLIKIKEIIENTPYISDLHKEFLFTMIKERKNKILDVAIEKHFSSTKKEEYIKIPPLKKEILRR